MPKQKVKALSAIRRGDKCNFCKELIQYYPIHTQRNMFPPAERTICDECWHKPEVQERLGY